MIKNRRAFIVGIRSLKLTKQEKIFLKTYKPWGVILFLRNIKSIKQTKNLTDSIKNIFKDKNYPILISSTGTVFILMPVFFNNSDVLSTKNL